MQNSKFNRDKILNQKLGQHFDNSILLEEAEALRMEEEKDVEVNMLRESISRYVKMENQATHNILKKQQYLNESQWFALKSYITRLCIEQAKSLYDFKALKEEYAAETKEGVDKTLTPEEEIEQEVEETLKVEVPISLQGEMGTVIPVKIEVTPETADVLSTVLKLMDQQVGSDKLYLDSEQIETAAKEAVKQIPSENKNIKYTTEKVSNDVVDIVSKDQQILAGLKAKMDELDLRVAGTEEILSQVTGAQYEEPLVGEPKLFVDEKTGLLYDAEGNVYDENGNLIQEDYHREMRPQTILQHLSIKKGMKQLNEGFNKYNRNKAIVGGINSLIILETFNHVFGRPTSYASVKRQLKIK